jgi:ribosome modulation factor
MKRKYGKPRIVRLRGLSQRGYEAGLKNAPIDSGDYRGELERGAWEIGWRQGHQRYLQHERECRKEQGNA